MLGKGRVPERDHYGKGPSSLEQRGCSSSIIASASPSLDAIFATSDANIMWSLSLHYLDEADHDDRLAFLHRLARHPRPHLRELLFVHWAEADPHGGLAAVRAIDDWSWRAGYFKVWGGMDIKAARAALAEEEREPLEQQMIAEYVANHPDEIAQHLHGDEGNFWMLKAMIAHLNQVPPDGFPILAQWSDASHKIEDTVAVAAAWASHDPKAALIWAQSRDDIRKRHASLVAVLEEQYRHDPDSALSHFEDLPPGKSRTQVAGKFAAIMARHDVDRALEWVDSLPTQGERLKGYGGVLPHLASQSPQRALDFAGEHAIRLDRLDPQDRDRFYEALQPWATADLARALRSLARLSSHMHAPWLETVAPDPRVAAETILTLKNSSFKQSAFAAAMERWCQQAPDEALPFASSLGDEALLRQSAALLSKHGPDPSALAEWSLTLPSLMREEIHNDIVARLAQQAPSEAVAYWRGMDAGEGLKQATTRRLLSQVHLPADARFEMLESLPQDQQAPLYDSVAYHNGHEAPHATSKWLARLPVGRDRDRAISSFLRVIAGERLGGPNIDHAGAFHWAKLIDDPAIRDQRLHDTLSIWRFADPEAARAALQESSIEDQTRSALEALFEP